MITVAQAEMLPLFHREVISADYLDEMGHMNVRWYMALFDRAAWKFFASVGMTPAYFEQEQGGIFALQQFIQYRAEVRVGEQVAVRTRVLGRSAKRAHFMHFMVNETTGIVASTMEGLSSHANLEQRRTSPFPPLLAEVLNRYLLEHSQLDWPAPLCGVMKA